MPYMSSQPKVLIAGGGIGGLSTALALHASGLTDIHIFEAAGKLTSLGVGINVQPSAVLILRNLGLLPELERTGVVTQELNFYNRHGDEILSEPRGTKAGYACPQLSIHRGNFQMVLLDAVRKRIGEDRIHLGHALVNFQQDDKSITGFFKHAENTKDPVPSMTGDVLIAADGINSATRKILYPNEDPDRKSVV